MRAAPPADELSQSLGGGEMFGSEQCEASGDEHSAQHGEVGDLRRKILADRDQGDEQVG
jgi:hypothetical protein